MANDVYMKIEKAKGESTDAKHKDWFELFSYSAGVSQTTSGMSATGGMTGGRADFQDFTVVKTVDSATPDLNAFCAGGEHVGTIEIEVCTVINNDQHVFMKYTMKDCLLTSVTVSGSDGDEIKPLETLTFSYSEIKWEYSPFDHTGKVKGGGDRTWVLKEHKKG